MKLLLICIIILLFLIWNQCEEYYSSLDPKLDQLKQTLIKVVPEAAKVPLFEANKSYSINKEKIYMCLKDEKGNYYDDNTLMLVLLHEIAHTENKVDVGHTENFHRIYENLKQRASALGLVDLSKPVPIGYCEY